MHALSPARCKVNVAVMQTNGSGVIENQITPLPHSPLQAHGVENREDLICLLFPV